MSNVCLIALFSSNPEMPMIAMVFIPRQFGKSPPELHREFSTEWNSRKDCRNVLIMAMKLFLKWQKCAPFACHLSKVRIFYNIHIMGWRKLFYFYFIFIWKFFYFIRKFFYFKVLSKFFYFIRKFFYFYISIGRKFFYFIRKFCYFIFILCDIPMREFFFI